MPDATAEGILPDVFDVLNEQVRPSHQPGGYAYAVPGVLMCSSRYCNRLDAQALMLINASLSWSEMSLCIGLQDLMSVRAYT